MILAKKDIVELVHQLLDGDKPTIVMFAIVILVVAGMGIYQRLTGSKTFTKKARREGRRRRGVMLWEHERERE